MKSAHLFARLHGIAQFPRVHVNGRVGGRVNHIPWRETSRFCCSAVSDDEGGIDKDFQLKMLTKDDVEVSFARSSGPGGQNVNKLNTKVDMRLNLKNAPWIPDVVVDAVHKKERNKINKDGELVVTSTKHRTQMANIDDAIQKMQGILEGAVESVRPREVDPVKKKKLAKQKKKANEVRLQQKKMASSRKKDRKVSRKDW
ncbi:hypothetical protein BSKO_07186 [Bryopsis sp. KO-2023]|nr:hypothetical protein BSKO_07186 [Bryopsis sp. KO-2023]